MLKRILSLTKKEFRQFFRDKSSLMIAFVAPLALILIFGYALSFDVNNAKLALVLDDRSPEVYEIIAGFQLSKNFQIEIANNLKEAENKINRHQIDGILHFQNDFTRNLNLGSASIQLILHSLESSRASLIRAYVNSVLLLYQQKKAARAGTQKSYQGVSVEQRIWFNSANTSTWYLVPGLIVLIMTLIGALLTALVMAREWERGTLEALFISPVKPLEIILAKMIPYFCFGMVGFLICILAAILLFSIPIQGSLILIAIASMFYMLVALGIGLVISAVTKNQFVASQVALLASFLPALMLSGFIFDLRNVPLAIQILGKLVPATYSMEIIKTLFLAGNNIQLFIKDCAIMLFIATLLIGISLLVTRKRLD